MPTLQIFDIGDHPTEVHTHLVSDRNGARRILAYDLRETADKEWGDEILAAFDAGENFIERSNGGHPDFFRVEYMQ